MRFSIRLCCWILLIAYLLILYKYLVLDRTHYPGYRSYNLIPFDSIKQYLSNKEHFNYNIWFLNLIGNLVMLTPLGVILPILNSYFRVFRNFMVFLFAINILIEIFQYYTGLGSLDIDDVIMNSSGAIVAYLIIRAILNIQYLNKLLIKDNELKLND